MGCNKVSRREILGISRRIPTQTEPGQQVSFLAFIADNCLARHSISCRSCEDHCDERAIRFRPRLGQCELPEVNAEKCTGCGQCVIACPNGAIELVEQDATVKSASMVTANKLAQ